MVALRIFPVDWIIVLDCSRVNAVVLRRGEVGCSSQDRGRVATRLLMFFYVVPEYACSSILQKSQMGDAPPAADLRHRQLYGGYYNFDSIFRLQRNRPIM